MKNVHESMAEAMPELSHLECGMCHETQEVGDVAKHLADGWPKHCGFTMTLVTKKQMEAK